MHQVLEHDRILPEPKTQDLDLSFKHYVDTRQFQAFGIA